MQQKPMVLMSIVREVANLEALLSTERCITSATSALSVLTNSTSHGKKIMLPTKVYPGNKSISLHGFNFKNISFTHYGTLLTSFNHISVI